MALDNKEVSGLDREEAPETTDEFFTVLGKVLSTMESAVEFFGVLNQEEKEIKVASRDKLQWKRPQLSAVSKRRLMNRTVSNLKSGIEELSLLKRAGNELQQHYLSSQLQHSAAERSRHEVYRQLQEISGSMHETSMKLHRAEEERLAAVKDLEAERERCTQVENRVNELQEEIQIRSACGLRAPGMPGGCLKGSCLACAGMRLLPACRQSLMKGPPL
mmetsp:Transcript_16581/g.39346  ORF Transcript_16581/g.39346 Transcript_16581/m.39346 type:complete len:218 (-) Transcript_16581:1078-1731(-)